MTANQACSQSFATSDTTTAAARKELVSYFGSFRATPAKNLDILRSAKAMMPTVQRGRTRVNRRTSTVPQEKQGGEGNIPAKKAIHSQGSRIFTTRRY